MSSYVKPDIFLSRLWLRMPPSIITKPGSRAGEQPGRRANGQASSQPAIRDHVSDTIATKMSHNFPTFLSQEIFRRLAKISRNQDGFLKLKTRDGSQDNSSHFLKTFPYIKMTRFLIITIKLFLDDACYTHFRNISCTARTNIVLCISVQVMCK